jgi:succinate-semialdehyde dehydrogenase/glutarate-semialdehyde dehydrogenase
MGYETDLKLFIDGAWKSGEGRDFHDVVNPVTASPIASVPYATRADIDEALAASERAWPEWRALDVEKRGAILHKAAKLLRERADLVAATLTQEQGKVLAEAKAEVLASAQLFDWYAEDAKRDYGRTLVRPAGQISRVIRQPVGPTATFTPWNFPIYLLAKKVAAALAVGCTVISRPPHETPGCCTELFRALADAGIPSGVAQLIHGDSGLISETLIASRVIRKVSFTGSTGVGKHLMRLCADGMTRVTMELGGHAPSIVFADADVDLAAKLLSVNKLRNAGQVCVSPTRLLVQENVYNEFVGKFTEGVKAARIGDGMESGTQMGPMANERRIVAMEAFIGDAVQKGATLNAGGHRIGNKGNYFEPTVLTDVPMDSRIMNEEPFGPVAVIAPFKSFDDVVEEANRLPYGLAAYAYTRSAKTAQAIAAAVETGMISINHHGLALPEVPFGGVKDSGYGSEGGSEAIEAYLNTKFVTQAGL